MIVGPIESLVSGSLNTAPNHSATERSLTSTLKGNRLPQYMDVLVERYTRRISLGALLPSLVEASLEIFRAVICVQMF